jgi:hypothetical protein
MGSSRGDRAAVARVAPTSARWREERSYLNGHRHELAVRAQELYPEAWRVERTPLLGRPSWIPESPLFLDQVVVSWQAEVAGGGVTGREPASSGVRPVRATGGQYPSYADSVRELSRPRLFEDRACYRILSVDVCDAAAALGFGLGRYFNVVDICEAAAHEFAAAVREQGGTGVPAIADLPFRSMIGDPTDLARRPMIPAISTLVLRHDRRRSGDEMILHWRDATKVASGGGLYQVTPVGMFQPSSDAAWNEQNDFDLWRSIVRELNEELLGGSENYGSADAPIDYDTWPLYAQLGEARRRGDLRVYWLGLGVDPLTLVTDLLAVAVFDGAFFDRLFGQMARSNEEGELVVTTGATGGTVGLPFTEGCVERFAAAEPMQPAGAALLRLAWRHREVVIGRE